MNINFRNNMINKNTIEVKLPEPFNGLDEESANSYFKAKNNSKLLKDLVITPFQELLKSNTGYSKENLPQKTEIDVVELGDYVFNVISERKAKRPQLKTIYNNVIEHDFESSTINGIPYVKVSDVLKKIQSSLDTIFLEEIKQTIKHEKSNDNPKLFVPLYQEMLLNESSANLYVHSDSLIKKMAEIIKPFEGTLNAQTDYNKDNIPDEMKKRLVPVGNSHLFELSIIPEQTIKYAGIFNALTKETKKLTKSTGELIRLRDGFDLEERLSGLYKPVSSNLNMEKEVKISIPGLIKRLGELKKEYTNPSLNIRRKHYPLV
tara:strand:+ start:432 stop:1388 length:957 start_codon:yes stop_codon:yes gene_type:complete